MISAMRNDAAMDRRSVPTDQRLRRLLKAGRRASGNLSQRAAAKIAGISAVYWQKIESGTQAAAPADTLAAMFTAAGVTPARLRAEGYPDMAAAIDELAGMAAPAPAAEDYLAATPGASPEEISALQAVWRALRARRTPDPFGPELGHTRRSSDTAQPK
jgi:transcriptional regulator with XRE-family HTH domain